MTRYLPLLTLLVAALLVGTAQAQVGHVLSGVGPVDQAWSGAGTANPQDALGALHWNPAAITSLEGTSLNFSLQLLFPTGDIASTVNQGALGPQFGPPATLSGITDSEAGPFPIPAVGFVHAPKDARWAVGLSAFGVGGFGVDYEGSGMGQGGNPVLTPQPPNGFGFGPIFSEFSLMQISPTVAYKLSEHVSIGVAPTLNVSFLEVTPFPATQPDDANGDGFPSYPEAPRESAFGYGFQAGVQVHDLNGFHLGASFKSTQHFGDLKFDSQDEMGHARAFEFNLDYPMILSFGIGYSGLDRWEFAADVRYLDFENTDGFNEAGFDQTGAVTGFGWNSIVSFASGVQYDVTKRLPVRLGYSFNQNPIDDEVTFFNTPSPAIIQHRLSGGFSYVVSPKVTASLAAQYGFENSIKGPWVHPQFGALPPTEVECGLSTFFVVFGIDVTL